MATLLELDHLRKAYGRAVILDDASLTISEGQKIALIGRNGAGKSTLLRILLGEEEADAGEVRRFPALRVGAVAQHEILPDGATALKYLAKKSGRPEWACARLAAQFGLRRSHLETLAAQLSGGFQMRLKLVAMLLEDPNLLVLDEPVNYLDLPTLLLLERFLKTFRGAFLVTSHDRSFLNAVADRTAEIERGELTCFAGPVDTYLEKKAAHHAFVLRTNKKISRQRASLKSFVDRFGAKASKAKQAQSKLKQMARLAELDVKKLLPTVHIRIPAPYVPPGPALRADALAAGYEGRSVVSDVRLELLRGDHAAILGANGMGKTTLLKTLAGILPPVSGVCRWWHKANIGFYAQHVEAALKPDDTVKLHLLKQAGHEMKEEDILRLAGQMLFREDDLEKPTRVLSGGERARLCLAGLLLAKHNVLLFDEPTNHLDAETSEALAKALAEYPGTVIFVSHSQSFIRCVAKKIFEVRDGRLRAYPGSYDDYLEDLTAAVEADVLGAEEDVPDDGAAEEKKRARTAERELRRRQQKLDAAIKTIDRERGEILKFYFENPTDYAPDKHARLKELEEELAKLEKEWLRLQAELDALSL